jgi:hypothetical protein
MTKRSQLAVAKILHELNREFWPHVPAVVVPPVPPASVLISILE